MSTWQSRPTWRTLTDDRLGNTAPSTSDHPRPRLVGLPALEAPSPHRLIFGIDFWDESTAALAQLIASEPIPRGEGVRMVATANIDHIVRLHENAAFRRAYDNAWVVTADGWPVVRYVRLFAGYAHGRVTGADLFPLVIGQLSPARHRIFCLTSSDRTAEKLRERIEAAGFPHDAVEIVVPPFGFEQDEAYGAALADRIRAFGTTHLFMGIGAPKSEIWVNGQRDRLGDLYACCFGAALNFYAGTRRRAPAAWQATGLEWAWRLASEPRRLAGRYLRSGPRYLLLACRDFLKGRTSRA